MTMRVAKTWTIVFVTALIVALASAPARCDESGAEVEHDRARNLVERGEIRPLEEILASLAIARPGEVVAVELDEEDGRWVYEVKVVTASGRRIEVEIDAATGTLLDRESD